MREISKIFANKKLRENPKTRNKEIKKGDIIDEHEDKEKITGIDARKEIVETYTGKLSDKGRKEDMRKKLGFDPKERKLIKDTIEGVDEERN